MYLSFFELQEHPFSLTPDPRFLYLGSGYREALARLRYSTEERTGVIVLTGEAGTGKTTLLQSLLQQLDRGTAVSYVFNSTLSFDDMLEYVLEELEIAKEEKSQAQRLMAFNNFLVERERAGQSTVLILDEAQNLDPSTLLRIGMLSNFEGETSKLLQIVLVGQPELEAKLELPELRELRQRISMRCRLAPLGRRAASEYIRDRLRTAGAPDAALFDEAAIDRITKYSGGIPRAINILADHCLLLGYANEKPRIDRRIVNEAIQYLQHRTRSERAGFIGRRMGRLAGFRWSPGTVGIAVVSAVAGFALTADQNVRRVLQALKELLTVP